MKRTPPQQNMIFFAVLLVSALTTSCGVKPPDVSAPPHVGDSTYPRTYPDISTDPKP